MKKKPKEKKAIKEEPILEECAEQKEDEILDGDFTGCPACGMPNRVGNKNCWNCSMKLQ